MEAGATRAQGLRDIIRLVSRDADAFTARRFVFALVLVMAAAVLAAAIPVTLKITIDSLQAGKSAKTFPSVTALVIVYALLQFVVKSVQPVTEQVHTHGQQRLFRCISRRMVDHVLALPLSFFLQQRTGEIAEALQQGLQGCRSILHHAVFTVLPVAVEFTAIAAILISLHRAPYLCIILAAAVAYALAFRAGAANVVGPSERLAAAQVKARGVLQDALGNYETLQVFGARPLACDRYDAALAAIETQWRKLMARITANSVTVAGICAVSLAAALLRATYEVGQGRMSQGEWIMILGYLLRAVQPMETLGYAARDLSQGIAFARGLLTLQQQPVEPDPGAATQGIDGTRMALELEGVGFAYGDRAIVRGISLNLPAGGIMALVGASGGGKTTLLRLLFRLHEGDGTIRLQGRPAKEWRLSALRASIGIVPQRITVLDDSIAANIAFGRDCSPADIEAAACIAHLHESVMQMPAGYQTPVGESGALLSGGQCQRLAIARAILTKPRLCIMDEATSALDTETECKIMDNLHTHLPGMALLIVAHRMSTIRHAQQILVLEHGVIVERGTHEALMSRDGRYAQLVHAQAHIAPETAVAT